MSAQRQIHLDGRKLEGGGQLLRLAVGLCALTGQSLRVAHIRGNRRGKGGMKLQHLRAVEFLATACSAEVEGANLNSKELTFVPSQTAMGAQLPTHIQIGSPGSTCLVIQAILPYLIFAGSPHLTDGDSGSISIIINGGTNISHSPSIDYFIHVLLPTLSKIGLSGINMQLHDRGWTGRSAHIGSFTLTVEPRHPKTSLPAWSLTDRGAISRIEAYLVTDKSLEQAATIAIKAELKSQMGHEIELVVHFEAHSYISYLLLVAVSENGHRLGRDWLYEGNFKKDRDRLPAMMATKVVQMLKTEMDLGGCVDEYMRDHLVVFQALAAGKCQVDYGSDSFEAMLKPSLHTSTACWVTEQILGASWKNDRICTGVEFESK